MTTTQRESAVAASQLATVRLKKITASSQLVLSIFHGADLLGRGFEAEGFCVVRAAEIELGFDIRDFHLPPHRFDGIIAGSPCQDFSSARRTSPIFDGYGMEMVKEFERVVAEGKPQWFLLENVPTVPNVEIEGYFVQRFNLNARYCGCSQNRLRRFQFGSRDGRILQFPEMRRNLSFSLPTCLASEGKTSRRRSLSDFASLQGLPSDFRLGMLSIQKNYHVIGNGVPVPMARMIARAICDNSIIYSPGTVAFCGCGCGKILTGKQTYASKTCTKRAERHRKRSD